MLRRRKVSEFTEPTDDDHAETPDGPSGVRANGPWDSSEKDVTDDDGYLDLGSLAIPRREGITVQMPTEGDGDRSGAVVLLTEDAGVEIRAFATSRSGGLWDEVRADLIAEAERLKGESTLVNGLFGPEVQIRVPVTLPDGDEGFQPTRVVGIEGPRWLLRATFLGQAALEPSDEGILMDCVRATVVNRGTAPMAPREPLVLIVPSETPASGDGED